MTKKNLILMIIALLILLVDGTSYAAARKKKKKARKPRPQIEQVYSNIYARIDFGASIPAKKLSGQYDRKFDSTVLGGVGAGFRFSEKFKTDITIQYRKFDFKSTLGISTITQNLGTASFMLNGYYNILSSSRFSPYIMAGAGIAHTKVGDINDVKGPDIALVMGKKVNKFAWCVGAGINSKVSKKFNIDIGYKYIDFGKVTTTSTRTLNGAPELPVTPFTGKLQSHEITIGIIYNIY